MFEHSTARAPALAWVIAPGPMLLWSLLLLLLWSLPARADDGVCGSAREQQQAGKLDEALVSWRSCLEQDGERAVTPAEIYFAIGAIQLGKGELAYAMDSFTSALELAPQFAAAYLERARAHRRAGMKQESIDDSGLALQYAKDDAMRAMALTHRGDDYARLNLFARALTDLNRAVELDEHARAYLSRARVNRSIGNADAAIADLDGALKAEPDLAVAYLERSELYALTGKHARAVRDAEQAVRLESDNAEAHAYRCRLLNSLALARIGLESCLTAVRLDPQADRYQLEHAFARWQIGDTAGMRTALGLQPSEAFSSAGDELIESFPGLLGERLLASLGYPLKGVDGLIDAQTEAALAGFEAEHGKPASTSMDQATVEHLQNVLHTRIRSAAGTLELSPPEPVLEVMSGPAKGRTITLWDIPMTLGRQGGQVARIESGARGYTLTHVSGAPAPTLNGKSMGEGASALESGDVLGIFGVEIAFTRP